MPADTVALHPRPVFPLYLLPSFPFRRRKSSTTSIPSEASNSSTTSLSSSPSLSPSSSPPEPHFFSRRRYLKANKTEKPSTKKKPSIKKPTLSRTSPDTLRCSTCATDIAFVSQIVSKGFTGRHGRAFLVSPLSTSRDLINTRIGRACSRQLVTGAHVVADISCTICSAVLGWKYVDAKEATQRYKIGKYILETKRVASCVDWRDADDAGEEEWSGEGMGKGGLENRVDKLDGEEEDGTVVFDSEDEDECDDLFAGVWDPAVVAKRRGRRIVPRKRGGGA